MYKKKINPRTFNQSKIKYMFERDRVRPGTPHGYSF